MESRWDSAERRYNQIDFCTGPRWDCPAWGGAGGYADYALGHHHRGGDVSGHEPAGTNFGDANAEPDGREDHGGRRAGTGQGTNHGANPRDDEHAERRYGRFAKLHQHKWLSAGRLPL